MWITCISPFLPPSWCLRKYVLFHSNDSIWLAHMFHSWVGSTLVTSILKWHHEIWRCPFCLPKVVYLNSSEDYWCCLQEVHHGNMFKAQGVSFQYDPADPTGAVTSDKLTLRKCSLCRGWNPTPIGFMYGIFLPLCTISQPNVGNYPIHGSCMNGWFLW